MQDLFHLTGQYIIIHALCYLGWKGVHAVFNFVDAERHQLIANHVKSGHKSEFATCDHSDCEARKTTSVKFLDA